MARTMEPSQDRALDLDYPPVVVNALQMELVGNARTWRDYGARVRAHEAAYVVAALDRARPGAAALFLMAGVHGFPRLEVGCWVVEEGPGGWLYALAGGFPSRWWDVLDCMLVA